MSPCLWHVLRESLGTVIPLSYGCQLIHEGKREAGSQLLSTRHIFCSIFNNVTLLLKRCSVFVSKMQLSVCETLCSYYKKLVNDTRPFN